MPPVPQHQPSASIFPACLPPQPSSQANNQFHRPFADGLLSVLIAKFVGLYLLPTIPVKSSPIASKDHRNNLQNFAIRTLGPLTVSSRISDFLPNKTASVSHRHVSNGYTKRR